MDKSNNELYDEIVKLRDDLKENTNINNKLISMVDENTKINNKLIDMLDENTNIEKELLENNKETYKIKDYTDVQLSTEQQWKSFGLNILANVAGNTIKTPTFLNL
ncbi:MAG: hypothetical protein RSD47_07000 [Romboutsia sp.]